MRNVKTNHTGLAAVNLYLHNMLSMNRYYWQHRKEIEFPLRWGNRIKQTIIAALIGWTPWHLRTEKQWERDVETRNTRIW